MKHLTSVALSLFICFCLVIATARQAFGYVDPGSGLLALQSAASIAAACAYFLRRRIRSLFVRSNDADKESDVVPAKETTTIKAA